MAQIKAKQIELVAVGDLIVGASTISGFSGSVLSIGAVNQVLTSNGTTAAWGYINALRDSTGDAIVVVNDSATPINTIEISAGGAGSGPIIEAVGSDTNIDINLTIKGTGEVLVPVGYMATSPNALITKQEVDAVATGLDFKNSVRAATTSPAELSGFIYVNGSDDNSSPNPLVWTGAGSAVFDGITIADGDRVIIKDSTDQRGNGVFVFEAGVGFHRTTDADNTPDNEVSGGLFAFVEEGDTQADTGWVVSSPDGLATLGTDDIVFTQFSQAGVFTPGDGLEQLGTLVNVTVDDVTIYIDGGNDVAVKSSSTANEVLLSNGSLTTPAWGALPLNDSNAVTGTLDETNGGTGETTYNNGDLLVGESTGGGLEILPVTDGAGDQVLIYNDATDTVEWTSTSTIGGNAFGVVTGDIGTANADSTSDTIAITGGIGISTAAADSPDSLVITFNNTGMADTTVVLTDTFPFFDGSNANEAEFRSFEDMFNDLNVAFDISGTGIVIKTGEGPDTYEAKSVEASTVNGEEGIVVTNGDGTGSGDIVVGVDIVGQTLTTTVDPTNDFLLMYDASAGENLKVRPTDLASAGGFVTVAFTSITGDTGTANADTTTDTIALTGGIGISTTAQDSPDAVTFEFDNSGMADTPITTADAIPFFDASNGDEAEYRNVGDLITDLGLVTDVFTTIVGDAGTNPVAQGSDTLNLTGGIGITTTGDLSSDTVTFEFDNSGMADTAITPADAIPFFDASNGDEAEYRTISSLITDLGLATNVFVTVTGDAGSATADSATDTIAITGGIGISTTAADSPDSLTIEFNNTGMADTPVVATDTFPFFDGSNGDEAEYRAFSDLITDLGLATNVFTTITGDTGSALADSSADTLTLAGGEGIVTVATDSTDTVTFSLDINSLVLETVIDQTADEFVFYDVSAGVHRKTTLDDILDSTGIGAVETESTTAVGTGTVFAGFFTNTPVSDDAITVYFNGLALDTTGWTRSGTTLTLIPGSIGYSPETGDVITARYEY